MSGLVRATTVKTSQMGPLVMNVFVPLRTHPSPSRRPFVRMLAVSEPASGSVMPKAPIYSPLVSLGR